IFLGKPLNLRSRETYGGPSLLTSRTWAKNTCQRRIVKVCIGGTETLVRRRREGRFSAISLGRARAPASPQELKLCGAVPIGVVESAMSGMPSAEVFQVIVDRIGRGGDALDLEGKISYWNYGAEKISGFLSQEVLGRACRDSILVEYDDHNPVI